MPQKSSLNDHTITPTSHTPTLMQPANPVEPLLGNYKASVALFKRRRNEHKKFVRRASSDMKSMLLLTNLEDSTIQSASMALSGSDCAGGNHFSFLTLIQNSTNVTFCGSRPKGVLHGHSHSLIMAEKLPREPMRQRNFCLFQTNNDPITQSSPRTACI